MTAFEKVKEFHAVFGSHAQEFVGLPTQDERNMRKRLLQEEYLEYLDGEEHSDIVEIADGLVDMLYIIYGTGVSYGLPMDKLFDEVHSSNMSKLDSDGNTIYRADGKILKGPNYFKPRIQEILDNVQQK